MSDDPAVKRAVLREHGYDVPDKGKLSNEHLAAYERLRQAPRDSYDGGVTAADFDDDDYERADEADEVPGEEATPRGIGGQRGTRAKAARAKAGGLFSRARKAARPKVTKRRHAWVGTADVIEHFWSQLAWSARPIPPLAKILAAQAPTAGVVLQDALRGSIIDRAILQPAARFEDRAQAINAMAGPPIWTAMIASFGGAELDNAGRPITDADGDFVFDNRTQAMVGGLRFSLMSWLKIAGKSADEIQQSADDLARLGDEADKLIRWILSPPEPGQSPKDMEKEARAKAMKFISKGTPAPESNSKPPGAPPARFASSAFDPKPAAGPSGGQG